MQHRWKKFAWKYSLLFLYFFLFAYLHVYFLLYRKQIFLVWFLQQTTEFLLWIAQKDHLVFFAKNILPALLLLLAMVLGTVYILYISIGKLFLKDLYIVSQDKKTRIGTYAFKTGKYIYFYTGLFPNLLVPYSSLQKVEVGKEKIQEKTTSIEIHTDQELQYIGKKTYKFADQQEKTTESTDFAEIFQHENQELLHKIQQKVQEASMVDSSVLKRQIEANTVYIPQDILSYIEEESEDAGRTGI